MTLSVGLHDIPVELYHSDPCAEPSLSSSGISTLLSETPAHFRAQHPRLCPTEWLVEPGDEKETSEQRLGTLVHALVLGKGQAVEVIHGYDDWKKKDAQEKRRMAREAGHLPVLRHEYEQAITIAEIAAPVVEQFFPSWLLGESEITGLWKRRTSDDREVWCRMLMDRWLVQDATIVDLKTTSHCISDLGLAKKLAGDGADIQAAHYINGIETIFPSLRGHVSFAFVVVETEPPYSVRVARLRQSWLHMAAMRIDRATDLFADCLAKDEWPAWSPTTELEAPNWRSSQFETAELLEAM